MRLAVRLLPSRLGIPSPRVHVVDEDTGTVPALRGTTGPTKETVA